MWPRNCQWTYSAVVAQEVLQRRWEPWRWGVWWWATGSWQRPVENHHGIGSSYSYARSCWRIQRWPFYSCLAFEANWKGKKLGKWVPHAVTEKKNCFQASSYSTQQRWTISLSNCDVRQNVDLIWQLVTTSSVVGLRNSKALPVAKLVPKNAHSHWFGGLLLVWSTTAFWIPVKPLHMRSVLSKLMRCTENFNALSQHWSAERAQFSTTTLNCTSHNQCFKSWTNWATKFHLIHLTSRLSIPTSSRVS